MKKTAAAFLSVIILLMLAVSANAANVTEGTCGENLTWSYDAQSKTLTVSGSGSMKDWHSNRLVPWRHLREEVEHISLPGGLTKIGDYAFFGFKNLKEAYIPSSAEDIGNSAFSVCTSLKEIRLPSGVKSLGGWVFAGCTSLENITFPSTLTSINYECFFNCPSLMDVTIPQSVRNLGVFSFGYNASHAYNYNMILRGVPGSNVQSYAANNYLNFVSVYARSSALSAPEKLINGSGEDYSASEIDFDGNGIFSVRDILLSKKIK